MYIFSKFSLKLYFAYLFEIQENLKTSQNILFKVIRLNLVENHAMNYSKCLVILRLLMFLRAPKASSGFPLSNLLWKGSATESTSDKPVKPDDEGYSNVKDQLKKVACPARANEEMLDYWRCLWRTSLTAEGIAQERMGVIERYYESAGKFPTSGLPREERVAKLLKKRNLHVDLENIRKIMKESSNDEPELESETTAPILNKQRKKRSTIIDRLRDKSINDVDLADWLYNRTDFEILNRVSFDFSCLRQKFKTWSSTIGTGDWLEVAKVYRNAYNNRHSLVNFGLESWDMGLAIQDKKRQLICLKDQFKPGMAFKSYLGCLKDSATELQTVCINSNLNDYKNSDLTYLGKDAVKMDISGSVRHYSNKHSSSDNNTFELRFTFHKLDKDDDKYNQYHGADPYLTEQDSEWKYRYDNLAKDQKQPGWSYVGKDGTADWHNLGLRRFYIPLRDNIDLQKMSLEPDIAQSYPGVGDIVSHIESIVTPLEYLWKPKNGYFLHNRFLLPLLDNNDLNYYKSKGAIPQSITVRPDSEVLNDIINALQTFQREAEVKINEDTVSRLEDIKFFEVYKDFVNHYYGVDLKSVLDDLEDAGKPETVLFDDFDNIRQALYGYLEAVVTYEACTKDMVDLHSESRSQIQKEEMKNAAQAKCPNLGVWDHYLNQPREFSTMPPGDFATMDETQRHRILHERFKIYSSNLDDLYVSYFERKEARKRYSLPVYPYEFPICRHSEPSPINILTSKAKKSSLREYTLGESGTHLNRAVIMLPMDGTPLFQMGIHDGLRLDKSSVPLSGGAVKGHNLTFQYMFFRFSHNWDIEGSEHQLDGVGAPMEIQMLFTISGSGDDLKYWQILARVQNQMFQFREKLILMISFLVDVLETDELVAKKIAEKNTTQDPYLFEPIAQAAYLFKRDDELYRNDESESDVPRGYVSDEALFRLSDFIPKRGSRYFTYRGSLTWPPCFGYVLWSVFEQRLYMSKRQFDMISKIPAVGIANHNLVADNYRNPEYIFVEAEDQQDYATQQRLKNKRTVDRYVLEGLHDPTDNEDLAAGSSIVDHEAYYQTDDEDSAASLGSSVIMLTSMLLLNYLLTM